MNSIGAEYFNFLFYFLVFVCWWMGFGVCVCGGFGGRGGGALWGGDVKFHIQVLWLSIKITEIVFAICTFDISSMQWIWICMHWQKPAGFFSLLDEESMFPKATDMTFVSKLKEHLNGNACFKGERGSAFRICHFAGEVSHSLLSVFLLFQ